MDMILLDRLALGIKHVEEAERRVVQQHGVVKKLELDGHDSQLAKGLLREFERTLELHRGDLARIATELEKKEPGSG